MAHAAVHKHIIHVPHDLVAAICAEQREEDAKLLDERIRSLYDVAVPTEFPMREEVRRVVIYALSYVATEIREGKEE